MSAVLELLLETAAGGPYWVLLGVLLLCGVGLPLPEDVPLIAAGILCAQGDMHAASALVISIVGVLGGDSIVYLAGRHLGVRALSYGPLVKRLGPRRVRRMRALYRLRGERVVFFARFLMGVRLVAFFLAGALGVRYRRFLILDGLAALVSVPIWIGLGYWLGTRYGRDIERALESTEELRTGIGLVLVVIAAVVLVRWVRLLRQARSSSAASVPDAPRVEETPERKPREAPATLRPRGDARP